MFDFSTLGTVSDVIDGDICGPGDLRARIAGRLAALRDAGIGPGGRTIIVCSGTPAFFADLFAVWAAGACAVCVSPDLTAPEFANVLDFVDPGAVLTGPRQALPDLPATVPVFAPGPPPADPRGATVDAAAVADSDPALILFTSGTTGTPKGVVHTFASLKARIALNHQHLSPEYLRRTLSVLPTHFGHGLIGNALTPLLAGGDLFLMTGAGLEGAARLGAVIDEHRITFMSSTPAVWRIALKVSPPPTAGTLRLITVGSAPLARDLARDIAAWAAMDTVWNVYGITEAANWVAGGPVAVDAAEDGVIGPMWGGEAAVRAEDGSLAAIGDGEIVIRSPALMAGYYRQPALTAVALRDGWYHTGDRGSIDGDGIIRLTGRIRDEINRGGIKVAPEEIDLLLERHDRIAEACAFAVPDPVAGEVVGVAVRLSPGAALPTEVLRTWCLERIRRECVPERWFVIDEIPKTDRGKLNRDTVRQTCLEAT